MRHRKGYYIGVLLCTVSWFASCSTQKNTWASRNYHATTTRYNIYFNGNLSFEEGLKAIDAANEDDFSQVIPLYPVSNHTAAEAAVSQMDRTIEKCRKCIKLHSIKKKPKADPKKHNDPKYQAFLRQNEFNRYMWEAWVLLGKAEFHKGDFLGSIGTFNYIARDYQNDKNIVAICQLWTVRAYAEMGWLYEAEEVMQKINQDDLSRKYAYLYAAVNADLKLKTQQYREAIPFVKIALKDESRAEKTRYNYVLGQLYELQGNKKAAIEAYRKVTTQNPSAAMDFSARIKQMELSGDIVHLKKMANQYKYRDKLDYVYGALGNIYLQKGDTTEALKNYQTAIDNSTQGGIQKAMVLIIAGDLYYQQRDYNNAQPCYTEAVNLISSEMPDYRRIAKRAETLDELIVEYNTVVLQDSLQHLSTLSEEEQLAIVKEVIAAQERAEQEALEKAAQAAREAQNGGGLQSVNTQNMLGGGGGSAEWYFYNPQLMRSGKQVFVQRWGNRPLEDNWRRISKTTFSLGDNLTDDFAQNDSIQTDSLRNNQPTTNQKDPQFYLQQIPKTAEEITASNALIATALYNMVYIYQDKVGDMTLANETYQEFRRRFPNDSRLADLYYTLYLTCLKKDDIASAEIYKNHIVQEFPESKQASIVSDPNYFKRLQRMAMEQDSLYEDTYTHYKNSNFSPVKQNTAYAEEHYPFSPLMPKFLFLNAIAVAKTEGQDAFIASLRDMVHRYPESETGAMAKDMLAMMNQGMESQQGGTVGNITAQRTMKEETTDSVNTQTFSLERKENSTILICLHTDEAGLNNLLYQVALFNFSQFLIKDFDLKTIPMFGNNGQSALQISGFDSMDETDWYCSLLMQNMELQKLFEQMQVEIISITDTNYPLLFHPYSIEEYKKFADGL